MEDVYAYNKELGTWSQVEPGTITSVLEALVLEYVPVD